MFKCFRFYSFSAQCCFFMSYFHADHLVSSWLFCWFCFNLKYNDLEPMADGVALRLLSLAQSLQHLQYISM